MQFSSPSNQLRANIRHLYLDITWIGITSGTTSSFLAIYATRLGASNLQIGLLTAGPAIVNLLISLPVGHWLEGHPLVRASFWSAFWQRIGLILFIFMPWLLAEAVQTWGIVGLMLLVSAPTAVLMIAFNALFAEVVPPPLRGEVVGKRNALSAVTGMIALLVSGQILDRVHYPYNYQIVFTIGAVAAMMSAYHIGKIRSGNEPALHWSWHDRRIAQLRESLQSMLQWRRATSLNGRPLLRLDVLRGPFGLFMGAYLAFYTFQYVSLSIGPLYFVRTLNLRDSAIGLGSALFNLIMMLTSLNAGRLALRLDNRRLLVSSGMLFGLYPLLMGLAREEKMYWVASAVGGIVWAVLNVGMINRLMERIPVDDRPAYMATHNMVLNLGILMGSLIGPLIGDGLGLRAAMFAGAGLRTLAGLLLWLWG
jgi:MFS family permease